MIAIDLSQRDETKATIRSLKDEVEAMKTNFKNLLMKKSVEVQRQCWANIQYSRRESLNISGTPTSIPQQNLQEKNCQIFEAIAVSVNKNDIGDL